ncbi:unnamed protein product, partial [Linum tenue]
PRFVYYNPSSDGFSQASQFLSRAHIARTVSIASTLRPLEMRGSPVRRGPGSGKGTQCEKIAETFGFTHLSAGDLLRKEMNSNSEERTTILNIIQDGKIVPSAVTVKLIMKAMESSDSDKFLIDGFPRTEENRIAFEQIIGLEPKAVLFFDCPEEEMVQRVLNRNQGRVDDNIDTIKKRLKVFETLSLPVIDYYSKKGKLHKINAVGDADEIFEQVRAVFEAPEVTI